MDLRLFGDFVRGLRLLIIGLILVCIIGRMVLLRVVLMLLLWLLTKFGIVRVWNMLQFTCR